ncbi:MAG: hypothetical protein U1F68_14575 [Gammaproteobacteria bacterium]
MNIPCKPASAATPPEPAVIECNSPPCQAHEVDPVYMGFAPCPPMPPPQPMPARAADQPKPDS